MPPIRSYRGGTARRSEYSGASPPYPSAERSPHVIEGLVRPGSCGLYMQSVQAERHVPNQLASVIAPHTSCRVGSVCLPQPRKSESNQGQPAIMVGRAGSVSCPKPVTRPPFMTNVPLSTASYVPVAVVNGYPTWQQPDPNQHTGRCVSNTLVRTVRHGSVVLGQPGNRAITHRPIPHLGLQMVRPACLTCSTPQQTFRTLHRRESSQSAIIGHCAPREQPLTRVAHTRTPARPGSSRGGSLRFTNAATSPSLPALAKRDKVSKAPEQFHKELINEESIESIQQVAVLKLIAEAGDTEDTEKTAPAPSETDDEVAVSMDGLSQAHIPTQDSMPEIVEMQYSLEAQGAAKDSSEESSLTSNSSGGKDLPKFDSNGVSSRLTSTFERNASWSHSRAMAAYSFDPLRKTATPRRLRRGRTTDLEVNMSGCRKALEQLKHERKEHDALMAQSPDQQVGTHPLLDKASSLGARLTDLAAEALECGCDRDVPGAMDVYEQANASLDALSDLLRSFTAASTAMEDEEETGGAAWPSLDENTSDEKSSAPVSGLSRFLRVVGG
mmetsp:Transcript_86938/g.172585  ORF Transcript_86938/g.172585 Transcript_86938/m.172585 type:complete len:555 (+) Transcript_86938:42-1706(+)